MKLLLDTHTFIWYADGNPNLSPAAGSLLIDPANDLFLSIASAWEIAIKVGLKKLSLSQPFLPFISDAIQSYGIVLLPITLEDCEEYRQLPFPNPNHRDPFDRMIIAQAIRNGFSIVGSDSGFDPYGLTRLW